MSRRVFLKSAALASPAILASSGAIGTANAGTSSSTSDRTSDFAQKAASISAQLFADDGLAIPIATKPTVSPLAPATAPW